MTIPTLKDYNFRNKRVIVRADLDIPLDEDGDIVNDKRLQNTIPTIKYLLENNAQQIIIIGHVDRPKGEVVEKLRTTKIAERFSELLGHEVVKADGCVDIDLPYGKVVMLENLRFNKAEKSKQDFERQEFAKKLADYTDYYVNESFANSHRKHASMYDITKYIPGCIGKYVEEELKIITDDLVEPKRPFIAIMGGAKVSDKLGAIKGLLKRVDKLLLGGAMVFTFFKALGKETGKSLVEDEMIELAKELYEKNKEKIILPVDMVCAEEKDEESQSDVFKIDEIPGGMIGLDIGPETINQFKPIIKDAQTCVWNGPMGLFEIERFSVGTNEIANEMAECNGLTIISGGDSVAAIENLKIEDKITHISSGGGASLELFEGKKLIAIEALEENYKRFKQQS